MSVDQQLNGESSAEPTVPPGLLYCYTGLRVHLPLLLLHGKKCCFRTFWTLNVRIKDSGPVVQIIISGCRPRSVEALEHEDYCHTHNYWHTLNILSNSRGQTIWISKSRNARVIESIEEVSGKLKLILILQAPVISLRLVGVTTFQLLGYLIKNVVWGTKWRLNSLLSSNLADHYPHAGVL